MMNVDIFIKTYYKDFEWLQFCLASIKKYATGFRYVVIVCDGNGGHMIPWAWLWPQCKVRYVPLPITKPSRLETSIGYLHQQNIKLNWFRYTDADAVLILDSDWMLTQPTSPDHFKQDGKFTWCYRDWSKADTARIWKEPVEVIMKRHADFEAMAVSGYMLLRTTSLAFKQHLCHLHDVTELWDMFIKLNVRTASEFNMFGLYVYHYSEEYTKLINYDCSKLHNATIRSSWSWGGLSDEERAKRQCILDKSAAVSS